MIWQKIETAPMDGTPVLLWGSDEEGICLGYRENGSWWNNLYEPWRFNPTHWMPLPQPPEEKE